MLQEAEIVEEQSPVPSLMNPKNIVVETKSASSNPLNAIGFRT